LSRRIPETIAEKMLTMAQDYGYASGYNSAPAGQLDSLVSRIALYPDPLRCAAVESEYGRRR
jgi:hypothetical protein